MTEPVRLANRVVQLLGCSRDDAECYIRNGWVSVDGQVIEAPQHPVSDERIEVDPDARLDTVEPATVLLHKPVGFDAIEGRKPAASLVTPETHWADDPSGIRVLQRHFLRLTPMVELDNDASGLLVLTQDGRVWRRLAEDADQIEHEYLVETAGEIAPYGLHKLNGELVINDRALVPCKVSWQNETRLRIAGKGIRPGQLRAMCAHVGLDVLAIRRLRIGKVPIGKGPEGAMPPGQWRYLPAGVKF